MSDEPDVYGPLFWTLGGLETRKVDVTAACGRDGRAVTVCAVGHGCDEPAVYVVTYDEDYVGGSYPGCVACTAEARANDPLEYIESVRSLPSGAAGWGTDA